MCSGPLECGVNGVCGGSCPPGQSCKASPVPLGCTATGTCECRLGCGMDPDTEMCVGTCPEGTLCLSTAGGPCSCLPSDARCEVINQQGMCGVACPGIRQMCLNEFQG